MPGRVAHAAAAICALRQVQRPVYESHPPVPEIEEIAGGELAAPGVVNRDRAQFAVIAGPVEKHDEGAPVPQCLEMADRSVSRE